MEEADHRENISPTKKGQKRLFNFWQKLFNPAPQIKPHSLQSYELKQNLSPTAFIWTGKLDQRRTATGNIHVYRSRTGFTVLAQDTFISG